MKQLSETMPIFAKQGMASSATFADLDTNDYVKDNAIPD